MMATMARDEVQTGIATAPLRLIVVGGNLAGQKFLLEDGAVIGRGGDAAIPLPDASVSRCHARITAIGPNRFVIEDEGSTNGTFVNDVPVDRAEIALGDRIRIGSGVVMIVTRFDASEAELQMRNRLEMIGRVAAGLLHDIKNAQAVVLGGAGYVLTSPPGTMVGDEDIRESLEDTCAAANETVRLLDRVLRLSRGEATRYDSVELGALVRRAARFAKNVLPPSVRMDVVIDEELSIIGDDTALLHSLLNICINAGDAMPDGGTLTLRLAPDPDAKVALTFRDTGIGMSEAVRQRIFEPFFSKKRASAGYGIGLSVVHSTVLAHGGRIEVASAPGEGTTFKLILPLAPSAPSRDSTDPPPPVRVGSVLVADDDETVRRTWVRILRRAGHEVEAAVDGADALDRFEKWCARAGRPPDLVLLDRNMPGVGGVEVARRVQTRAPAVAVALISADLDGLPPDLRAMGKPLSARDLLAFVEQALAEARLPLDNEQTRQIKFRLPPAGS
jgi:signal transduction histidine kinase/CheY-like chemotaxis protein